MSERKRSYNALGPEPGFSILYLTESFNSPILPDSTRFADKGIVKKPKVTEVLSPKVDIPIRYALCNGVKTKQNKTDRQKPPPGKLLS